MFPLIVRRMTTTCNKRVKKLSPAVLWHVENFGLDPGQLLATGPKDNILKGDVLNFLANRSKKVIIEEGDNFKMEKIALIIPEQHIKFLRSFVKAVDPSMLDRLLAKAFSHAVATIKSPNLPVTLTTNEGITFKMLAGAPMSIKMIDDKKDSYLNINLCPIPTNKREGNFPVNVNISQTFNHYLIEFECQDKDLKVNQLLQIFSECINDPYLMLL